jgi:PHD/YefM family antitoxin component YafN of YafNO toxin-antitoxin module
MTHITFEELENNLKAIVDRVKEGRETVSINIDKDHEIILVDAENYNSYIETSYLIRNAANAQRLQKGMQQYRLGQRKVIDVKAYMD